MRTASNHPHVTLLVGWRDGEPYILQEVYLRNRTTAEIIEELEAQGVPKDITMYCDSSEPDRIRELQQSGFKAIPSKKGKNSVRDSINWLKNRCIHVDGQCIHMAKELQAYRYKKDRLTDSFTDEPMDIDNDCVSALRYSCEPHRRPSLTIATKEDFGFW